ncbi:MAG: magnesium chelatase family protein [Pseudoalteromonas tetraodonis]|jgi:magnesium chelatase family protein
MSDKSAIPINQASEGSRFDIPAQPKSLAMIQSRTVIGVTAVPVIVEVHLANGLPNFSTVGLPEAAVKESKDRVRGAIINSGFDFPAKRITVNLAPADVPKTGGRFDLPIALGILVASGQLVGARLHDIEAAGELALDGQLRRIKGVLPTALACGDASRSLIIPSDNAGEAAIAEQTSCFAAAHLLDVCRHLTGHGELALCPHIGEAVDKREPYPDLRDVKGQHRAKRALQIAASGGHSILFIGPPGTGKSMLAARLPGLLPDLTQQEALESAAIYSVADGEFNAKNWRRRPFRAPHHSASAVALVGGGSYPRPGEISLAHQGILFLDELTEFSRSALEQLREPLETGKINIARANQSVQFPANFQLVTACNPCPCGYLGDGTERCHCSQTKIEAYTAKLSGPMLDRIDMHLHLPRVDIKTLQSSDISGEKSSVIQARSAQLRQVQLSRQGKLNSQLSADIVSKICALEQLELDFLVRACEKFNMSARAYHRILKLARTIADLEECEAVKQRHLSEAISFRALDRF